MPRLADPDLPLRRRAQIRDAARYCFHARGFRSTTIEDICAEARVSPGALYRYFASKADIVAAIAIDGRKQAESALSKISAANSFMDGVAAWASASLAGLQDDGDAALMVEVWAEAARDPVLAQALAARDAETLVQLTASIAAAARSGTIYPALSPAEAAETLLAALDGIGLRLAMRRERSVAEAAGRFRSLALHILKPKR